MTPAWWAALGPVTAPVACGDTRHEVTWQDGGLYLDDHPDALAEGALGALGGPPPACLRVQAAWQAHAGDVGLVTLGRRPGEADLGFPPEDVAPLLGAFYKNAPRARRPPPSGRAEARRSAAVRRAELMLLLSLPAALLDRLVLTAMARAAAAWDGEEFRVAHGLRLGAALAARATPALRRFGGLVARGMPVEVHCAPAGAGESGSVTAELTGDALDVTAALPLGWLSSVWGPGISEPDGWFVLGVDGVEAGALGVRLLEWEPVGPAAWTATERAACLQRNDEGLYGLR